MFAEVTHSTEAKLSSIDEAYTLIENNVYQTLALCTQGIDSFPIDLRSFRRYIRRILVDTPDSELRTITDNLRRTCRYLLFSTLRYNTHAFPYHFFLEDPNDPEDRSAFNYYRAHQPQTAYLASVIYHEFTRTFDLNSCDLQSQVRFLTEAVEGKIERITTLVDRLFDLRDRDIIQDVYELFITARNPSDEQDKRKFCRDLERAELAVEMSPNSKEQQLFKRLCNQGYIPPLAAIGAYLDAETMPPAVNQAIAEKINVVEAGEVLQKVRQILTHVYCCSYNSSLLARGNKVASTFFDHDTWKIEAQALAVEVPNLLKKLEAVERCSHDYKDYEVTTYLRKLIESVPGFIKAYCSEAKPASGAVLPLPDYTNRNLGEVQRGTEALEVMQELFPNRPMTDREITNAWWSFEAIMACDDIRHGDNFRDATTLAAAVDFRRLTQASTDPDKVIRHYFSLRQTNQSHTMAIACLDSTYPEFAADMESSERFVRKVREDPELEHEHDLIKEYHPFHATHQRLAQIATVNIHDPVLKKHLAKIDQLPYSLGKVDIEAFPVDIIEDLQSISSFGKPVYDPVTVKDLEQYNKIETIVDKLAGTDNRFVIKVISNYQIRTKKRFRYLTPLFPAERLAAVTTIFEYVNTERNGMEEKIKNYPPTYEAYVLLKNHEANYPFVNELTTRYKDSIKSTFGCAADKQLFSADQVEELVILCRLTPHLINAHAELREAQVACRPWRLSHVENPFIAGLVKKVDEAEVYYQNIESVVAIRTYVATLSTHVTEQNIRDYPAAWRLVERLGVLGKSNGHLGGIIRRFNEAVTCTFGSFSNPLFPLDLIEEVVALWHYAQYCKNSALTTLPSVLAPNLDRLETERTNFPFIAALFKVIHPIELCRRHRAPWALVLGEDRSALATTSNDMAAMALSESERIMLAIVNGHCDRAAEEWLQLERRKSLALMPFGAKAHVLHQLDQRVIKEFKERLRLKKTLGFKLFKNDDCLLFPPSTVVDFQLRFLTLMKLGIFNDNEGDLQFTCGGRLSPDQAEAGFLASLMLFTTPTHVTYAPGAFHTTADNSTGRRILLTDPLHTGVRVNGLPFDLPQAHGRIDMLGMRNIKKSPFDWQLWTTLTVHSVFNGNERFKKLYEEGKHQFCDILGRHSLGERTVADIITRTKWLHIPETSIILEDVKEHEAMVADVCKVRKAAMQKEGYGIVGESIQLLNELRAKAQIIQHQIATEKPEETARLLAGF